MLVSRFVALVLAVLLVVPAAAADVWLFTYPPLAPNTQTPNPSAPFKEWVVWFVSPTQTVCEEQKALWHMVIGARDDESVRAAARRAVFARGIPPPSANLDLLEAEAQKWVRDNRAKIRGDQGVMNQILAGICMSSEDQRLAPAPAK
jgi:hypothetical protein